VKSLRAGIAVAVALLLVGVVTTAMASDVSPARLTDSAIKKLVKKEAKRYSDSYAEKYAEDYAVPGRQGPTGPQGPQGAQGPAGVVRLFEVESPHVNLPPGGSTGLQADCPAGTYVTGTGSFPSVADEGFVLSYHYFSGGSIHNNSSINVTVYIQATCAQGPGLAAKTTAKITDRSAALAEYKADLRKFEAASTR
jgi:hypothetical protein